MKKCSCEKKTHKNEFHTIFDIKEGIDLNTIFNCNKKIILIAEAKILKFGNPHSCSNIKVEKNKYI